MAESETLLQSTKKDVKSQLDNLALLTGQIEERRKYINTIESDVHILTSEIASLQKQLNKLQRDLKDKKQKYEISVQYMYRNKSVQEKLMFIFFCRELEPDLPSYALCAGICKLPASSGNGDRT